MDRDDNNDGLEEYWMVGLKPENKSKFNTTFYHILDHI